jgi:tetrahydromethanopterin S-methyltransferase subunit B
MSPKAWSTNYDNNFRLFLLRENSQLVASSSPIFGFGIGSVSDKRTALDGSNPLYRTWAGRKALTFGYLYDGNWGLLIMEVGFLGIFALALVMIALFRIAIQLARDDWLGLALLAQLAVVVVLGFFAPILQLRLPTAILWLTAGLCLAIIRERRAAEAEKAAEAKDEA